MEMASTYKQYLAQLVEQGKLSESVIDQAVARIRKLKLRSVSLKIPTLNLKLCRLMAISKRWMSPGRLPEKAL